MSQRNASRPIIFLSALLAVVVVAGGLIFWRLNGGGSGGAARVADQELERRRVAALDPTFDPAKPGGTLAGVVNDADGRPVPQAIVAAIRLRGRDELPAFSRPIPRTTVTGADGRFRIADVVPGDYGLTATAAVGSPGRQTKIGVTSGNTTEVTLTLGKGGFLLTGEVTDVGGGPIGGATAVLRTMGMYVRPGDEPPVFQVSADDKGVFKLRLGRGDYDVMVKADGYAPGRDRLTLTQDETRRYRLSPAARLAGRVLDRQTREPVAAAAVWLRLDRLEGWVDRNTTSDSDGRFQFDDLAAGGYVVMARGEQRIGLTQVVSLGIAQAATDVEVLVDRGRAIRGTVVDGKGQPAAGVRVAAVRADPPYERPAFVKSASDGKFALEGLLPAKYRVDAWMEGQGPAKPETTQLTSKDVENVRLTLLSSLIVRGQVLDASGQPVAEASVTGVVESSNPDRRFSVDRTNTDSAGKFELMRLGTGRVTVTAKHPDKGNASLGPQDAEATAKQAVVLRLAAAATVSGTVKYEDGKPAARVIVFAQSATPRIMFGPPDQVVTDDQGQYRLTGLDTGKFNVMVRRETMFNQSPGARQEVTLAVGEQKSGVDLLLPPGGKQIAGKVVGADGKPVGGAQVTLAPERGGMSFRVPIREGGPQVPNALTDQDGNFALDDLPEGTYSLWATEATHADAEQKGVTAGTTSVVLKLQASGSVTGVVRTRGGEPVSDYTIAALPGGKAASAPDERMRAQMNARAWSPSAQVHDPGGAFQIGRLGAGTYDLTVTTADGQGATQPVTLTAGERKQGVTLVIDAAAKLVGRVLELDSQTPLPGVTVAVESATSRLEGRTGADGTFTVSGLPPGRARVMFRPPGNLNEETHVAEHTDVEPRPGAPVVDVGTVKLMKGSYREKFGGDQMSRGRIGFTPAVADGRPMVTGVRPGMPADKAGLKDGELLLKIDGHSTQGLGNGALDFLAAGKVDKPLVLTVQPREGGGPRDVTLTRVPLDYDPARPNAPKAPVAGK